VELLGRRSLIIVTFGTFVMNRATRESTVVALFDWQGRVVWISERQPPRGAGFLVDEYVREDYRELVRRTVSGVIKKRETGAIQVVTEFGEWYRTSFWPIDSQEVAACALAIAIPEELALLSVREQDCLKLLAHGQSAATIAGELGIAVSTVHTHFRRAREKLKLPNLEALISFAARFCNVSISGESL
jgi:DNA-binding CsgD family transcriptional regulator